jgi:GTP pyrophosphokinase
METMPDVKEILAITGTLSPADEALIRKAYDFAKEAHKDHKRLSGDPYFIHLFATAKSLAELGMGPEAIAAGFLHDSIEDVNVTQATIEKEFGKDVLFLVEGVTKLGALKYRGATRHVESLRKLFVATSRDVRVIIIKLMDRLHNMQTLSYVKTEKQQRIALETLEIYAPIADRLGMGSLKRELEDLAFPFVFPAEYEKAKKMLAERMKENDVDLEKVQKTLKKELAAQSLTSFRTEARTKGIYSFYKKAERKGGDVEKIYDVIAIRIILQSVSDCYRALGIVHSIWRPLPGKIKDYIAFPKPNGYQSIHTTVFTGDGGIVEIQIRTEEMHREAQYGIAAHFSYKETGGRRTGSLSGFMWLWSLLPRARRLGRGKESTEKDSVSYSSDNIPRWIADVADTQTELQESDEFFSELKGDFFSHRVFVFTPKGDVVDLPIDSSPVDFAYAIHSDIGNHISGVKVNRKLVTIDTKLRNGDIVEIITKKAARPTRKWLELVKTAAARKHIRAALEGQPKQLMEIPK